MWATRFKLARFIGLSSVWAAMLGFLTVAAATAHEIRPAVADIAVGAESATIEITLTLESLVAGIDFTKAFKAGVIPGMLVIALLGVHAAYIGLKSSSQVWKLLPNCFQLFRASTENNYWCSLI